MERIRSLKQEAEALEIEFAKAVSELEQIETTNQAYKFEIEYKRLQYEEYKMKKAKNTINWHFSNAFFIR